MSPINPAAPPPTKSQQAAGIVKRQGVREWIGMLALWSGASFVLYEPKIAALLVITYLVGSLVTYLCRGVK